MHWGATTQDVMDTALVLQIRDGLVIFEDGLKELQGLLAAMAREHRNSAIAGRTHGQQALPTTFGFKVSVWLAELLRHRERTVSRERTHFAGAVRWSGWKFGRS